MINDHIQENREHPFFMEEEVREFTLDPQKVKDYLRFSHLSNREIDARVWEKLFGGIVATGAEAEHHCNPCIPDYSTDDNAARLMRNRVAELDRWQDYLNALHKLLPRNTDIYFYWQVVQATPRQQCEASLLALEAE